MLLPKISCGKGTMRGTKSRKIPGLFTQCKRHTHVTHTCQLRSSAANRWHEVRLSLWGDTEECRFPIFSFIRPLPLEWMLIAYLVMFLGAVGMMLGLFYRASCLSFVLVYWYLFALDKTRWNNHSYLFGLLATLFLLTDAHRYWSLDGLTRKSIYNSDIPLWNYLLFRVQIFLVYFIAGLKKLDWDWVQGYSMERLASHRVFSLFRVFLEDDQISFYIVHLGGLTYDLSCGFLLCFDKTRPLAFFLSAVFHGMNAQIFSIGMFPYAMCASILLFAHPGWPKKLLAKLPSVLKTKTLPDTSVPQKNDDCMYEDEPSQQKKKRGKQGGEQASLKVGWKRKLTASMVCLYTATQVCLPYSHHITKGYNSWMEGLYGYSWDMMVHNWSTQHVRISFVDDLSGDTRYLDPDAWIGETRWRWSSHVDMVKQYADCIVDRLDQLYAIKVDTLYFDVWKAINHRFQQRMYDPRVDISKADWSPFKETTWLMPLLINLSPWRRKLEEIEDSLDDFTNPVFVADFPGLSLENFIDEEMEVKIMVLSGEVELVYLHNNSRRLLGVGDTAKVPSGEYHNIRTVSTTPSCYMYLYLNTTLQHMQITAGDALVSDSGSFNNNATRHNRKSLLGRLKNKFDYSLRLFKESFKMTSAAITSLLCGRTFEVWKLHEEDHDEL